MRSGHSAWAKRVATALAPTLTPSFASNSSIVIIVRFRQHKPSWTLWRSRERNLILVGQTRIRSGPIYTLHLVFPNYGVSETS